MKNATDITFIIDESGSMGTLTNDTIGGYNTFLAEQQALPGEAILTTILFNHRHRVLENGVALKSAAPLDHKRYRTGGTTALLDTIGYAIDSTGARLAALPEAHRPNKVLVLITTDGEENSSRHYDNARIKEMIQHQTEVYGWQFVFLGANQDSFTTAKSMGISLDSTFNYTPTAAGTQTLYRGVSSMTASYRTANTGNTVVWDAYKDDDGNVIAPTK